MPTIEYDIVIPKPVSEIFQHLIDFDAVSSWQTSVVHTSLTAANPLRIGSMLAQRRRFMGREQFLNADVTDLQRNKVLELKGMFANYPFRRTIKLEPRGRETYVHDEFYLQAHWLRFFITPFVARALRKQITQEWQNLKQILE